MDKDPRANQGIKLLHNGELRSTHYIVWNCRECSHIISELRTYPGYSGYWPANVARGNTWVNPPLHLQESFSFIRLKSAVSPWRETHLSTCFSPLLEEQCLISKTWKALLCPKIIILGNSLGLTSVVSKFSYIKISCMFWYFFLIQLQLPVADPLSVFHLTRDTPRNLKSLEGQSEEQEKHHMITSIDLPDFWC